MSRPPGTDLPSLDDALRDAVDTERAETLHGADGPEARALAAVIGGNVRQQRVRRGLALEALAERTGIRADLLDAVEEARAVPSVRAMWALATGLEIPFGALLAQPGVAGPVFRVQRAAQGRVLASAGGAFRSRALTSAGDARAPEVYELTLAPGCYEEADAHGANTFEHLTVVRGLLVVTTGGAEARLGPGDSLFFRADAPHAYRNAHAEETVVHLVITYS